MGFTAAAFGRGRSGWIYRKLAGRVFGPWLAGLWQQLRAFFAAGVGFGRADAPVWLHDSFYHSGNYRHRAGVFPLSPVMSRKFSAAAIGSEEANEKRIVSLSQAALCQAAPNLKNLAKCTSFLEKIAGKGYDKI